MSLRENEEKQPVNKKVIKNKTREEHSNKNKVVNRTTIEETYVSTCLVLRPLGVKVPSLYCQNLSRTLSPTCPVNLSITLNIYNIIN